MAKAEKIIPTTEPAKEPVPTTNPKDTLLTEMVVDYVSRNLIYRFQAPSYKKEMSDPELIELLQQGEVLKFALQWGSMGETLTLCRMAFVKVLSEMEEKKNG